MIFMIFEIPAPEPRPLTHQNSKFHSATGLKFCTAGFREPQRNLYLTPGLDHAGGSPSNVRKTRFPQHPKPQIIRTEHGRQLVPTARHNNTASQAMCKCERPHVDPETERARTGPPKHPNHEFQDFRNFGIRRPTFNQPKCSVSLNSRP